MFVEKKESTRVSKYSSSFQVTGDCTPPTHRLQLFPISSRFFSEFFHPTVEITTLVFKGVNDIKWFTWAILSLLLIKFIHTSRIHSAT